MVKCICGPFSRKTICHDPVVDEGFRFVSWGDRPYLYNITIGLLEAREYTQEEVDEAIKKARANRIRPVKFIIQL